MTNTGRKFLQCACSILTGLILILTVGMNAVAAGTGSMDLTAGVAMYLDGDADEIVAAVTEHTENTATTATAAATTEATAVPAAETLAAPAPEAVPEETQISTFVMSNVNDSMNVRSDASEDAESVGKLFKNCGAEILEQRDGWTHIKSGNLDGWAKDEYLLFGAEAEAKRAEVGTLRATVLTDALRVRKEASEDAGVYGLVKNGEKLTAIEQSGDWVSVQYDEESVGYIAAEFVSVEFAVDTGKTTQEIEDEERAAELKKLTKNRGAIPTSVSDVTLLAALIQCEAGGQPYDGQVAVGAVVMNRVRNGSYGGSILSVITAPGQFPPATNGKMAAIVASGPKSSCVQAAQAAVNGETTVGGATHFARTGSHEGIAIGNHVFW